MTFQECKEFDRVHIWHPYASVNNPPPVNMAVSAEGTRVRLDDGSELIDAISSWWCVAHGHNHPAIVEAIREQTARMSHVMFAGFTHEPAVRLAEALVKRLPEGLDRIFFADSGSIAVECAVKMAVQYQSALGFPRKSRLVALAGGYHGDTLGAMALSDPDGMHVLFGGVMPKHLFADRPETRFGGEWDEADFASMLRLLDDHAEEIAAVIVEPIFQGANRMWFYHPQYLRRLREECTRRGMLLVFDEIATGFGRLGRRFAADFAGVVPDIMCVGKILTGGAITLAATVASKHVADVISSGGTGEFMHGPTYMANPLACAAGCASLKLLDEYGWQGNVERIGREFTQHLEEMRGHANVVDVRVLGAVAVLELRNPPSHEWTERIVHESGVWLRPFSRYVYSMPPFICTSGEILRISQAMRELADER